MKSVKNYIPTIKILFALTLLSVVVVFAIQNSADIVLRFILWSTPPLNTSLVLFAVLVAGIIIGMVLSLISSRKTKKSSGL